MLGFNDPTNGLRDIVDYVERLKPQVFYPVHHDFVAEYGASQRMKGVMEREMARRGELPTEVRWLYDPTDYLRPGLMTFDPADRALGGRRAAAPTPRSCMRERLRVRPSGIGFVEGRRRTGRGSSARRARARRSARFASASTAPAWSGARRRTRGRRRSAWSGRTRRGTAAAASARARRVAELEHRYRRTRPLGRGLRRASPGSHIVFGTRRGRVRFVAVATASC